MRHGLGLALVALALWSSSALGSGIDLRWTGCDFDGGSYNRTFACNSNTGVENMYLVFDPPQQLNQVIGLDATIDIVGNGSLPDWWKMQGGGCRAALSMGFDFTNNFGCEDPWLGQGAGGATLTYVAPDRLRIHIVFSSFGITAVTPGLEYYGARITISHTKTVGTGSCANCSSPVCIFPRALILTQDNGAKVCITDPRNSQDHATWQGGIPGCTLPQVETLSIEDASALEGNAGTSNLPFTVKTANVSTPCATFNFSTMNGTALAGSDYSTIGGRLTVGPLSDSMTINVPIHGDAILEPDESFSVNLSNATGATIVDGQGAGTILNDEDPVGVGPVPDEPLGLTTWPNPAPGHVRVAFRLPGPMAVGMEVVDPSGRSIRTVSPQWLAAGRQSLAWDGRRNDGRKAGSGMYLIRLQGVGFAATGRVILVR